MTKTIALAGNPNVGKSTLFNALTGSRQHVGNWPGKTVEKKEGTLKVGNEKILVVDLPGTYSLTAYSVEEIIARDYIINEKPSAVVAVVDASNLERNLYLVTQLLELNKSIIIALNMTDVADKRGMQISADKLSGALGGIPVVKTVGSREIGLDDLKKAIAKIESRPQSSIFTSFGGILAAEFEALKKLIEEQGALSNIYQSGWLAVKLLENDEAVEDVLNRAGFGSLLASAETSRKKILTETGEDAETLIADQRYQFIGKVVKSVMVRPKEALETFSDKVDAVVTHRIWGLPIFLLMMWIVFQVTANVSAPFLDYVDLAVNGVLYSWGGKLMSAIGLGESWMAALLTDGIIAGVGGVLVFVPVLVFLYLTLALLEDSGYMARAAFVMDRVMRAIGLHGKSFIPMIVGFGCTVPAIYATRTLGNENDRKLTGFLTTFMSCGARLPVYVVFGAAFFGAGSGNLIFSMYLIGIAIALLTGFVMKRTLYRGQPPSPFVMELPPYRMPRVKDVWKQVWERTGGFLRKASTIILGVSIALWLLMAIPAKADSGSFNDVAAEDSIFGTVSSVVAPIFSPAGFGTWEASGSLVTGILAKEVVVGTMNQIYVDEAGDTSEGEDAVEEAPQSFGDEVGSIAIGLGEAVVGTTQEIINIIPRTINLVPGVEIAEVDFLGGEEDEESTTDLEAALVASFNASAGSEGAGAVAAVAFNVFVLLYIPCMVAVAAMRQEFGAKWMWAQIIYTFALAWVAAVVVFQVGKLLV